jgi:hypothetical protein
MSYLDKTAFVSIACFVLLSCNLESNKVNQKQVIVESEIDTAIILSEYNSRYRENVQSFDINTSKQETIKGRQGTVVTFSTGCFEKAQGKVKIELIECYSIQDMLLNRLSTETTDSKLLESDGMIYLNALNEQGDILKIKQEKVKVQMPTPRFKKGIKYFWGTEQGNYIIWNLGSEKLIREDNSNIELVIVPPEMEISKIESKDSLFQPNIVKPQIIVDKKTKTENLINYVFSISKMGWINCDRYIEGKTEELIVNVPKNSIGASYYLVLKNYNSSVLPKKTNDGRLSFMLPLNEPYTIVALSSIGELTYFNMQDYTGKESEVDFSELQPITRQELMDKLLEKFGKDIWSRPLA